MTDRDCLNAVKTLALLVEEKPTARLCMILERALKGYGDQAEAARWGRMAVSAAREPEWSDLDPRGGAFQYTPADWARLVYSFGDAAKLIHPRYETSERELDLGRPLPLLGAGPQLASPTKALAARTVTPPLDYAPDDD